MNYVWLTASSTNRNRDIIITLVVQHCSLGRRQTYMQGPIKLCIHTRYYYRRVCVFLPTSTSSLEKDQQKAGARVKIRHMYINQLVIAQDVCFQQRKTKTENLTQECSHK
ncbi:hypothetical protein GOODEAATRI_001505 [Goodea atripinnis]|uniref:Uncharacterized protein n=1 Tax=Goodea atripinnis TaxID=208336 RepID=A0ABV0MNK0_9TELE